MRTIHRNPTLLTQAALLLVGVLLFWGVAWAQEELKYYNIKAGPVRFILTAGMQTEFNDNVNQASGISSPVESDIILNPHISLAAISELQLFPKTQTDVTTIGFTLNLGTRQYLMHPELTQDDSFLTIKPDSELSFLIRTGSFRTRIYDRFSLEDEPNSDGTLSNVAVFRRFTNHAGFRTIWDVNSKTQVTWGYEHGNLIPLKYATLSGTGVVPTLGQLENSTDQFTASIFSQVFTLVGVGVNGSVMSSAFPENPGQNSTNYQAGPFAEARLTQYTTLRASYSRSQTEEGALFDGGGDASYAASTFSNMKQDEYLFTISNRFNRYYTHSLSVGRQMQYNILGNLTLTDRIIYESTWTVNSKIALRSSIFAEDATDQGGGIFVNPHYKRYGCRIGTSYQLSRKLNTTLEYQYSNKISDDADQSYKQNMITLGVNYAF